MKDTNGRIVVEIPEEALKDMDLGRKVLNESIGYNRILFNSTMRNYIRGIRETLDGHTMLHGEHFMLNLFLDLIEREVDEMFWKNRDKPDKTYEFSGEKLGGPRKSIQEHKNNV